MHFLMRQRLRRPIGAALGCMAAGIWFAASCTQVLDLDGYEDAAASLCEMLDRCFGRAGYKDCEDTVKGRLESASDTSTHDWLAYYGDNHCLADCTSAWKCLDVPPVCLGKAKSCNIDEDCCGFSKGRAACG